MNLPKAIWTITGGIVFIAVLTQTRIIQNLLKIPAKTREDGRYYDSYAPMMDVVKVQPRKGWYDYYGNGYGYHDEPFQYSGTESEPRAQTDQQQEDEELTQKTYKYYHQSIRTLPSSIVCIPTYLVCLPGKTTSTRHKKEKKLHRHHRDEVPPPTLAPATGILHIHLA
jgi:hypothetical protein